REAGCASASAFVAKAVLRWHVATRYEASKVPMGRVAPLGYGVVGIPNRTLASLAEQTPRPQCLPRCPLAPGTSPPRPGPTGLLRGRTGEEGGVAGAESRDRIAEGCGVDG